MKKFVSMFDYIAEFCAELADKDPNTYFIGIDGYRYYMAGKIQEKYPDRVIGAGISEQNAISMATGLALSGKTVYVFMIAAYATRRALDQFKFACYCNANIRVITSLSGISHSFAGFSHMAQDDIPNIRNTPNVEVYAPHTIEEIAHIMERSTTHKGPMYIASDQYQAALSKIIKIDAENGIALSNKGKGKNLCILYEGQAGAYLHKTILPKLKYMRLRPDVYSVFRLQPLSRGKIKEIISKYAHVVSFELRGEGALTSSVAEIIAENSLKVKFMPIRLQNEKYDIVGYVDFLADQYLDISHLHEKIAKFAKPFIKLHPKIKYKDANNYRITYSLFKIPLFKVKVRDNKTRGYLFGFIRLYKHVEK